MFEKDLNITLCIHCLRLPGIHSSTHCSGVKTDFVRSVLTTVLSGLVETNTHKHQNKAHEGFSGAGKEKNGRRGGNVKRVGIKLDEYLHTISFDLVKRHVKSIAFCVA